MTLIRKNTTLAKTVTFAAVHFTVAFSVGYLLTGSVAIAGALALLEPLANTLAYYGHERLWARFQKALSRGQSPGSDPDFAFAAPGSPRTR
jgi:uncharacterized membrane protein